MVLTSTRMDPGEQAGRMGCGLEVPGNVSGFQQPLRLLEVIAKPGP
ncbi:MAG: hypothetical protein ACYDFV_08705 [Vulcanimicrobiaceae bacterium]